MKTVFRAVETEDEAFLFALYAASRHDEMAAWGWDEMQRNLFLQGQFRARQMSYRAAYSDALANIVVIDGEDAGWMLVGRDAQQMLLIDIALLPRFQGNGIGSELVGALVEEARTAKKPLRLHVLKTNQAQRLYARLGFRITGEDEMYLAMESSCDFVDEK